MHYQKYPHEETKLIRCVSGSIFDVVIDMRPRSKTYLEHFSIELNDNNNYSLLVPDGFAHGFQTLKDKTSLIYHHTEFYNPNYEAGVRFNDEKIGIKWPLEVTEISERDLIHPLL
jgi:dTDP-4-dehydrorhamnose 3,5-epimerase